MGSQAGEQTPSPTDEATKTNKKERHEKAKGGERCEVKISLNEKEKGAEKPKWPQIGEACPRIYPTMIRNETID